jgi:hypothetical protein
MGHSHSANDVTNETCIAMRDAVEVISDATGEMGYFANDVTLSRFRGRYHCFVW